MLHADQIGKEVMLKKYTMYKRQRIVALWRDGYKVPTVVKLLSSENFEVTRQGVWDFLKKYQATYSISRRNGSGIKTKITEEIKQKVDARMEDDDETTVRELQKMLSKAFPAVV